MSERLVSRGIGAIAVAATAVFAAGCNAVLGNAAVSLYEGGASEPDATMTSDGGTPDGSAPGDEGGPGCADPVTPPILDGGKAAACAPVMPGACAPVNLTQSSYTWTPPIAPSGQCSAAQITNVLAQCFGSGSTTASCASWRAEPKNAACNACVYTNYGAASYGPLIIRPGDYGLINKAGCVALLDPCQLQCAKLIASYYDCEYLACNGVPACQSGGPDALSACEPEADDCACLPQATAANDCGQALATANSPATVCLSPDTYTDAKVAIPVFCGTPDAGG